MIILSANENLLERLVLLVQNNPCGGGDGGTVRSSSVRAQSVLIAASASNNAESVGLPAHLLAHCADEDSPLPRNWVLLMAKKGFGEHLNTLQTLADLYRLSMSISSNEDNQMRILVIKKERSDDDQHRLQEHLDAVRMEWVADWSVSADRFGKFGESDAQKEYLMRALNWSEPPVPNCALSYFDDPNLLDAICTFFAFGAVGFQIVGQSEEDNGQNGENKRLLFTKPPALHWTNYPRDSEVQVAFKFVFPSGTIMEWVFREWTKMATHSLCWDYVYEWTNGVLLRAEELIKVTITRCSTSTNVVEIAGRIDMDEAEEEMEQVGGSDQQQQNKETTPTHRGAFPLQRVWPYLAQVLQAILTDLENRRTLPFMLNLVFIGDLFFDGPKDAPKISARSLDAVQTLGSIQRVGAVRFRVEQHIYSLNLPQCFPGFSPTKLSDFSIDHFDFPPPKSSMSVATVSSSTSSPSADGATTGTSLLGSALQSECQTPTFLQQIERSPSCTPAIALSGEENADKMPLSPSNSLLVERQLFKHRNRRVSFGVIHAIPSLDGDEPLGQSNAAGNASPSLIRPSNRPMINTNNNSNNNEGRNEERSKRTEVEEDQSELENVVDEMLQKAIKEVLVTTD